LAIGERFFDIFWQKAVAFYLLFVQVLAAQKNAPILKLSLFFESPRRRALFVEPRFPIARKLAT
jgi:hypothetical protein